MALRLLNFMMLYIVSSGILMLVGFLMMALIEIESGLNVVDELGGY